VQRGPRVDQILGDVLGVPIRELRAVGDDRHDSRRADPRASRVPASLVIASSKSCRSATIGKHAANAVGQPLRSLV
jgi:hypothetical protein